MWLIEALPEFVDAVMHGVPRCIQTQVEARPRALPGLPRPGEALPPQARKTPQAAEALLGRSAPPASRAQSRGVPVARLQLPPDPPWALSLLTRLSATYPIAARRHTSTHPIRRGSVLSLTALPPILLAQRLGPRPGVLAAGLGQPSGAFLFYPLHFLSAQTGGTHRSAPPTSSLW